MIIISPAKRLLSDSALKSEFSSMPVFLKDASQLNLYLKKLSVSDIEKLMKVSHKIALLNYERNLVWDKSITSKLCHQAGFVFDGEVYRGLNIHQFSRDNLSFLNDNLRILSGLYGILRPFDMIYHYRLEMGTKLKTKLGKDLYEFWGNKLTDYLNSQINISSQKFLLNLASVEYSKAINFNKLNFPTYTPIFKNYSNGSYKIMSVYAKKARGLMVAFIIRNKISDIQDIKLFNENGYEFKKDLSTDKEFVFVSN